MDRDKAKTMEAWAKGVGTFSMIGGAVAFATVLDALTVHADVSAFAWRLVIWAVFMAGIVWSFRTNARTDRVLSGEFLEHEGAVAGSGRTAEGKGSIMFTDGYCAKLDLVLEIEPGSRAAVYRNGWNKLLRIDLRRP